MFQIFLTVFVLHFTLELITHRAVEDVTYVRVSMLDTREPKFLTTQRYDSDTSASGRQRLIYCGFRNVLEAERNIIKAIAR